MFHLTRIFRMVFISQMTFDFVFGACVSLNCSLVVVLKIFANEVMNRLTGVWVSILSAVVIVSALLWSLEWLSPYSYYNNM